MNGGVGAVSGGRGETAGSPGAVETAATTARSPRVLCPFCHLRFEARAPRRGLPKELVSLADHLRKRRVELSWSQCRTDREMGWTEDTARRWERGIPPAPRNWPEIIRFLGYDPRPQLPRFSEAAD